MRLDAVAAPLTLLAVALPFLFSYPQPPLSNFWPLVAAWACGAVLALIVVCRGWGLRRSPAGALGSGGRAFLASPLAVGLLLAALLAAVVGLLQYFLGDPGLAPWVQPSTPGQAIGNLRQRNQQASLMSLGVWALMWLVAQMQVRLAAADTAAPVTPLQQALQGGGREWPSWLVGMLLAWALALLAVASAATASRTGAMQWLLIVALLVLWRGTSGRLVVGLAVIGLALYALAGWLLSRLLLDWTGFATEGVFARIGGDLQACSSRRTLWSNVLYLIAQKPWTGWGWGELDYAHYMTLFPGERFCALLDNAHNLPLHLAVELGLPVAAVACGAVLAWVVRARPWCETDPLRQLAWGVLAIIGLHSMVEFPLWYGPFQLVTVLALALLWRRALPGWVRSARFLASAAVVVVAVGVAGAGIAWDYYRVSQLYRPMAARPLAYQADTLAKVSNTLLFTNQVDFALLTITALTRENAPQIHTLATELLHFSPEPRVIEKLIESALLLGMDDEVAFQLRRYRAAYPEEHARWVSAQRAAPPALQ
ncbi:MULTISPECIES: Wzy polymerase domain-containing protein [unclassified Acidovorax]|uniref:Wzy polymerase domain-containing protein n=1 Tax=unclassified Acidovorax TaxID=2684926 RepID=UPI000B3F9E19|nr:MULTISPECIES: Wzy polymerase domain-containing protein [unclassified Acidovorax]